MDLSKMTPEVQAQVRKQLLAECWKRGHLRYQFHETQQKIVGALEACPSRKFFLLCSRRLGKSRMLLTLAFELAIQKPGSRVVFLAPHAKNAEEIATDIASQILLDCPDNLRPDYNAQKKEFCFRHPGKLDSIVRLKGVNSESAENLRGGAADLVILDEVGSMDQAAYVVSSVVMPMTLTTNGRIVLATTPPVTPGHDSAAIYEQLAQVDAAVKYTIRDAPHIPFERKVEFLVAEGEKSEEAEDILRGELEPRTTTVKREYLCEFVTDEHSAVLPEFDAQARKEIVQDNPRPQFYDAYVGLDPGFVDRTGIVYGYFDYARHKVVVEDESLLQNPSTLAIAQELLEKERRLWEGKTPYMRVSDVDKRLILDLREQHGLTFHQSQKQGLQEAVNWVRNLIQTRQLEIHPRCKNLVRQMTACIWNRRANEFDRGGPKSEFAHYDLVAALVYFCRNINLRKSPYPPGHGFTSAADAFHQGRRNRQPKQSMGILHKSPTMKKLVAAGGKKKGP